MTDHSLSLGAHLLLWVFPLLVATVTTAHAVLSARFRRTPR